MKIIVQRSPYRPVLRRYLAYSAPFVEFLGGSESKRIAISDLSLRECEPFRGFQPTPESSIVLSRFALTSWLYNRPPMV